MAGSIAAFSTMAVAARQIGGVHDTFEIMAARSLIGFFLVVATARAFGRLSEVGTQRLPGHLLRNAIHFTGQNLWLWALTLIPLAQLFALEFTSPIWVMLLAPVFLGEKITRYRLLAAAVGFAGIVIVAKPDLGMVNVGVLAAVASALCFALTNIATKRLTRAESIVSIMFWLTVMQFTFGTVLALWDGIVTWPTTATAPWLALIGVTGVLAHFCLTSALRLAPATFVMPFDFARLPIIAVIGTTLYGEALEASLILGAVLIIVANLINLRAETRKPQPQTVIKM